VSSEQKTDLHLTSTDRQEYRLVCQRAGKGGKQIERCVIATFQVAERSSDRQLQSVNPFNQVSTRLITPYIFSNIVVAKPISLICCRMPLLANADERFLSKTEPW
jgi:hypothetical protein